MTNQRLPTLTLDPDLDPWERQTHGETTLRFAQFRVYLDEGRKRTLRKVAETLTRHPAYVREVSTAYRWVERAEAWDKYQDARHEATWLEERRKAAQHDAAVLSSAIGKVAQRLVTLDPADLEPGDLVRLLDVTMRHRRALFGDPTNVVVTGPGGGAFAHQLAELATLDPETRRAAVVALADEVRQRALAVAGGGDDE